MKRAELINNISADANITKREAAKALDSMLSNITTALVDGDSVQFIGFGTFKTKTRKARTGRSPKTGQPIEIKKAQVPVFTPGKLLKESVNG